MELETREDISRPLLDKSYWGRHVSGYQKSGLSKIKYCKQEQVPYYKFLYWCNKLSKDPKRLIPVKIKESGSKAPCVLELREGSKLLIYEEGMLLKVLGWLVK
jgi:hypothetical protein